MAEKMTAIGIEIKVSAVAAGAAVDAAETVGIAAGAVAADSAVAAAAPEQKSLTSYWDWLAVFLSIHSFPIPLTTSVPP